MRAVDLGNGFVKPSHRAQVLRIPLVSRRIVWIQLNRSLEFSFRSREVPVVACENIPKRCMRLGKLSIKRKRFHSGGLGLRKTLGRFKQRVRAKERITVGQTGIRESITGIFLGRLIEELDRLLESVGAPLVEPELPLEIFLVSFAAFRVTSGQKPLLFTREIQSQLVGNAL